MFKFLRQKFNGIIGAAIQHAIVSHGLGHPIFSNVNFEALLKNGYSGNADVFSIIDWISTVASNVPWTLSEVKNDKALRKYQSYTNYDAKAIFMEMKALEQIDSHELLDVWNNPNPLQTGPEFRYNWGGFKLSTGNALINGVKPEIGRNKDKFKQLHMLPTQHIQIVPGDFMMPIKKYILDLHGNELKIPGENVSHSKYFNPDFRLGQSLFGQSPLQAAFRNLDTSNEADVARMRAFENQGAVGIISSSAKDETMKMSTRELDDLLNRYQTKFGGTDNFNKVLFTTAPVSWNNMGLSPVDMAIMESKVHDLRTLCSVYRVQSQIFNDPENKIASNLAEAEKAAMRNAVMPLLNSLRDEVNLWLVPAYQKPGQRLFLSPDWKAVAILQEDIQKLVNWLLRAYWVTPNEKRRIQGMEPSIDPNMDKIWIPSNFQELGTDGSMPPEDS